MGGPQLLRTNPSSRVYIVDDFISYVPTGTGGQIGNANWNVFNTNGTAAPTMINNPDTTRQGVIALNTGTSAVGRCCIALADPVPNHTMLLTSGQMTMRWYIQIPVLSISTQRYAFRCGFGDSVTTDFNNGVYFEYDDSQSLFWRIKTANAATRTVTNTSIAVVAGTWYRLTLSTVDASSTFSYTINGASAGTITTNRPVNPLSPTAHIISSIGTTSKQAYIDYAMLDLKNATVR